MRRTLVLDVVGLTPRLVGEHTPNLAALARDAPGPVPGGRTEDPRRLHPARGAARRAGGAAGRVPALQVLGSGRGHHLLALDRPIGGAHAAHPEPDPDAGLSPASGLRPAA